MKAFSLACEGIASNTKTNAQISSALFYTNLPYTTSSAHGEGNESERRRCFVGFRRPSTGQKLFRVAPKQRMTMQRVNRDQRASTSGNDFADLTEAAWDCGSIHVIGSSKLLRSDELKIFVIIVTPAAFSIIGNDQRVHRLYSHNRRRWRKSQGLLQTTGNDGQSIEIREIDVVFGPEDLLGFERGETFPFGISMQVKQGEGEIRRRCLLT